VQRLSDRCKEQERAVRRARDARISAQASARVAEISYVQHVSESLRQLEAFLDEHGRFSRAFQREVAKAVRRLAKAEEAAARAYSSAFPESQESAEAAAKIFDARPASSGKDGPTDISGHAPAATPGLPDPVIEDVPTWSEWPRGQYYDTPDTLPLPLPTEGGRRGNMHPDAAQVAQICSPVVPPPAPPLAPTLFCDPASAYPFLAQQTPPAVRGLEDAGRDESLDLPPPVLVTLPAATAIAANSRIPPRELMDAVLTANGPGDLTPCEIRESHGVPVAHGRLLGPGKGASASQTAESTDAGSSSVRIVSLHALPSVGDSADNSQPARSPSAPEPGRRRVLRL